MPSLLLLVPTCYISYLTTITTPNLVESNKPIQITEGEGRCLKVLVLYIKRKHDAALTKHNDFYVYA